MAGSHYLKIKKKPKKQVKQEHISKKTEKRDKPKPGAESQAKELGIASGGSGGARRGWGGSRGFPRCSHVVGFSEMLALGDAGGPLGHSSHQCGGTA